MEVFPLSLTEEISFEFIAYREEETDGGACLEFIFQGLMKGPDFGVAEPSIHGVEDGPDMLLVLRFEFLHPVAQGDLVAQMLAGIE